IQKVQDKFTDRRARINALTYELETEASASGKKSKQKDIDKRKPAISSIEYPENHVERYNYQQLEEKYNELRDERTKLSAELGDVLKPVSEASNKMWQYVTDHIVDLTPSQTRGRRK